MNQDAVLRVQWLPGTDRLLGTCHCGAEHDAQDPVALWDWLHAHPDHPTADPDPETDLAP